MNTPAATNALFDDNETKTGRYSDPVGAMAEPDGPAFRLEKAYARILVEKPPVRGLQVDESLSYDEDYKRRQKLARWIASKDIERVVEALHAAGLELVEKGAAK
jgi:hypothetical protein